MNVCVDEAAVCGGINGPVCSNLLHAVGLAVLSAFSPIVSVEGLIGFKLQGFVNDATRTRDLDDIRALFKIHRASLDMDELRDYFALFNKPELLNELLG